MLKCYIITMLNLKWLMSQVHFIVIFITIINPNIGYAGRRYTKEDILKLREEVREMFNHAYSGYLKYAYPYDELRPLSCDGVDTWGSYSLTLIDALDTLAVMGNYSEFRRVAEIVSSKANFDANINVSVFETNIRIVGGLLSAHLLSRRAGVELEPGWPCNGPLLRLAEDVARRLIPAFDTATGMPYGTVNLRHGVPVGETSITCTAGVGTFIIEFGALSRLTGDPIYEEVALNALYAMYNHRSSIGLYGNHIDVLTGRWTAQDSGIGAGVDSYLEYLVKGALLMQRPELMAIFNEGRIAIDKHLKRNDWYLWVSMHKGQVTLPVFQSLEAYWPGVLSLIGDISGGMKSMHNYHQVWKQYGFTPEFYNIAQGQVGTNRESYPLRPELIESTMYLYRATKDPFLLDVGMDILRSIQYSARTKCGYATIKDCRDHSLENRMESFFLAETTKYLYLLFDPDNFIHNDGQHGIVHTLPSGRECIIDAGGYIFNTEAHPLDPGALLCCSENPDEPMRYKRGAARGERFTSFVKREPVKQEPLVEPEAVPQPVQDDEHDPSSDLPSAFAESHMLSGEEFLDKLKNSGAVDVVKVPPPSDDEVHPIGNGMHQRKVSLNMLQMIETMINRNIDELPMKSPWMKEVVGNIENAEIMINHQMSKDNKNVDGIENNLRSQSAFEDKDAEHDSQEISHENEVSDSPTSRKIKSTEYSKSDTLIENLASDVGTAEEEQVKNISSDKDINEDKYLTKEGTSGAAQNALNHDFSTFRKKTLTENEIIDKTKVLLDLVITRQLKTVKKIILMEADSIMLHIKKCLETLEITKNLVDVTSDQELKSQFFRRRLEVRLLASAMKNSVEETRKLLSSEEAGNGTVKLFKNLIEVVVDQETMKNFVNKYKHFIEVVEKMITIGKENYKMELVSIKSLSDEENIHNNEVDVNESEEANSNFGTEDSENLFHPSNWKADDTSYQVDDRERVTPVSKVDSGPLFTDKLRIKTETVVGLLPKSLVSSEIPFDPQVLLERIRANPKYYRNSTWMTQYELLTCLPQPYFTRITLSGEFFND